MSDGDAVDGRAVRSGPNVVKDDGWLKPVNRVNVPD